MLLAVLLLAGAVCRVLQAQVAVADINDDGRLELVAADARGNVAAFTSGGKEVWERHVGSQVHQVGVGSV